MAFDWKPPKKPGAMAMTSTSQCKSCGGTDFDDFCESGDRACSQCGTVLQENGIVSTVQFSESGGSSNVVGQFVSGDKGRPGGGGGARGRGRFGYSRDSRDITIQNGKKKIMQILAQLHLRHSLAEPAGRLFSLCVNQNYVQGRKTINIVAACVYIVCRQQNFPIMLIDISDKLAVNVYILGKTFQKLIKYLNLQTTVPIVDPAMYIKRFAAKLDLGNKTNAVCMTALKIIGSMKRDFLATGRQPAGVCCAALTLATRVNRIERSKEEIRKAVNVCDATVRKRLLEFEATPTSQLTVEELNKMPQGDGGSFPGVDDNDVKGRGSNGLGGATGTGDAPIRISEIRMDPPAFIANRIRDGQLKMPWTKPITPPSKHAFDRAKLQAQQANGSTTRKKKNTTKKTSAAGVAASCAKEQGKEKGKGKSSPGCSKKRGLLGRGRGSVGVDELGGDKDGGGDEGVGKRTAALAAVAALEASVDGGVVGGERSSNEGEKKNKSLGDGDDDGCAAGGVEKGGGKGKGKGKLVLAEGRKRKKVLPDPKVDTPDEEESEEESESGEEESEFEFEEEEEDEEEEESEVEEESEDGIEENNDDRLAFTINDDANTDEAREALTRHVLRIREREHGAKAKRFRAKRKKVENQIYSCLESMFDEDEKRARGEKDPGRSADAASMASASEHQGQEEQATDNGAKGGDDAEGAGGAKAGDVEGEAEAETKAEVSGDAGSSSAPGDKTKGSAVTAAAGGGGQDDDRGGGGGADGDGEAGGTKMDDWEMYLRTAEDQERTKTEWETENKDWLEDQEEKMRILAEEGGKPGFPKKKRKYNVSSRTGTETFGEVLQSEAAKNKSLKIDHAALQRVMNLDGSLKQIGEGGGDDDEPMEEVEEGDPAPPIPLPRSFRGGGQGFRSGRVKSPLTAAPSPSSSTFPTSSSKASAPASAAASKNLPLSKVEDKDPHKREPVAMAETKVQPWARKALDDGGEEAIKDALALLTKGGVGALTGLNAATTLGTPAVAAAASSSVKKAPEEIIEEVLEEIEEASKEAAAGKPAEDVENDDDGEEEDEEDDEDDEGIGGGLYGGDDYDDEDPYGEEA